MGMGNKKNTSMKWLPVNPDIYCGPFQDYCIKPEGRIHQNREGLVITLVYYNNTNKSGLCH